MGISRSATITISYLLSRKIILNKTEQKILRHIQENLELFDNEIETKINQRNINGNTWNSKIFEKHRNNKDFTKRHREKYEKYQIVSTEYDANSTTNTTPQTLPLSLSTSDQKEKEKEIQEIQENNDNTEEVKRNVEDKDNDNDNNQILIKLNENEAICIGLTLGESFLFVRERRNVICPNVGFCRQLEIWEKYVWNTNDTTLYQIPFFRPDLDEFETKNGKYSRDNQENEDQYQCTSDQCCIAL